MKKEDQDDNKIIIREGDDQGDEVIQGKTRAQAIIDGDIEPEPHERGLLNLRKRKPFDQWDKEELHAVSVAGGKAVQELHGERRTAKESLENFLTLKATDEIIAAADIDEAIAERLKRDNPNATLYDLIQAVAVGKALDGSMKAYELIRDTHGDKPVDRVDISGDLMTEADRAMIARIGARLESPDLVIAQDITTANNDGSDDGDI